MAAGVGATQTRPPDIPQHPTNPNFNMAELAKVPEKWRPTVLAMVEGRKRPQGGQLGSNNPLNKRLMMWANLVDPGFDENLFKQRGDWNTAEIRGDVGKTVRAANTFLQHAGNLENVASKLELDNEFKANLTNPAKIAEMRLKRDPRIAAWDAAVKPVLSEFAGIMKGSQLTDQQIKEYQDALVAANTPEERHAKLAVMTELMKGRLDTLAGQRNAIFNDNTTPDRFLFPQNRAIRDRLEGLAEAEAERRRQAKEQQQTQPQAPGGRGGGGPVLKKGADGVWRPG